MTASKSEPWEQGFKSYAGWVPNVRSHLSFSRIAAARSTASFTAPVAKGKSRVILVFQERASNDYPVWTWLAQRLDPEIRLKWFLEAETAATTLPIIKNEQIEVERDRQGLLIGTITLIPYQPDKKRRESADAALGELAELLGSRRDLDGDAVAQLRSRACSLIGHVGPVITLKFALMRTGECRVWYDQQVGDWDDKRHHWVAAQAYYFLKDIAHDHTHHDPSDDQITPLTAFDPTSTEEGHEDEIAWRRETMWSLSREIERRNREGGLVAQRQSLGIIAYAESFQASLMSHVRDASHEKGFRKSVEIHDFDFQYLKDSVRASVDVLSTKLSQHIQLSIAFVATLISSLALVGSLVGSHNASLPRGADGSITAGLFLGQISTLLPGLAAYPIFFAICAAGLLMMLVAMILADGPAGLFNRVQRTVSQFGRALAVSLELSPTLQWVFLLAYHIVALLLAGSLTVWLLWVVFGGGAI